MDIVQLRRHMFDLMELLVNHAQINRALSKDFTDALILERLRNIRQEMLNGGISNEEEVNRYFHAIIYACVKFPRESRTLQYELATPTVYLKHVADFLNQNQEFKKDVISGTAKSITPEGIITYFNLRAIHATVHQDWIPQKAKYHEYALSHLDKSVSWTLVAGVTVLRHLTDCVLMRGDTRTPDEIIAKGGFSPAVPDENYTDRANETKLPELKKHFSLRISFTSLQSIAERYVRNAAYRQNKQFSYLYFVNVRNMETIDVVRNIQEGRLGKQLSREELEAYIDRWVEETVVLGSSIPIDRIVKIYKYEVVPQDRTSTDPIKRNGYVLRGVYLPKLGEAAPGFEYKDIPHVVQKFAYKSVAMLSFNCKEPRYPGTISLGSSNPANQDHPVFQPSMAIQQVSLGRLHTSLPCQSFPLVSLNFDLARDEACDWRYTCQKMRAGLAHFEAPGKLYIESFGVCIDSSFFSYDESNKDLIAISPKTMAVLLARSLPVRRGINFHLLSSFGKLIAVPFMHELVNNGFTNCFVTSYLGEFGVIAGDVLTVNDVIKIYDFSTKDRMSERGNIMHRSQNPALADNKVITFWRNGKAEQQGYQQWIKENVAKYTPDQRKNLWVQNNIAVLIEISEWLEEQMMKFNPKDKIHKVLFFLIDIASSFHIELFAPGYDERDVMNILLGLFKSMDIVVLTPFPDDERYRDFKESYMRFRRTILPIIPIELHALGYDIASLQHPLADNPRRVFSVPSLISTRELVDKMLVGEIVDFSERLSEKEGR